jgi:tRNA pseudouridine38-40 synthase
MMTFSKADLLARLAEDAGLKVDRKVVLGKTDISQYLDSNWQAIEALTVDSMDGSRMLYGNTALNAYVKIGFDEVHNIQRIVIESKPPKATRYRLRIAYDGTEFFGFQTQKQARTVQSALNQIFTHLNQTPTICQGASRTDTGVHALGQIVHVDSPLTFSSEKWLMILNQQCPKDIVIKDIAPVHPLFHARYDVWHKEYRYRLNLGEYDPFERLREWHVKSVDIDCLEKNLKAFEGTHDFTSFAKGDKVDKTRTIFHTELIRQGDKVELVVVGNGFLHYMIRIMVGQLVPIAQGRILATVPELLAERSRKHTGRIAPAAGLYLTNITY